MRFLSHREGFRYALDAGYLCAQHSHEGQTGLILGSCSVMLGSEIDFYLVKLLVVRQEPVVGIFIDGPNRDQQGYRHADGQADDVERGETLALEQVPPGDEEMISDHGCINIGL